MSDTLVPDGSRVLTRRELIVGLAMLSASGIALARKPSIELNYLGTETLEKILPKRIGRFKFVSKSGLVVPPNDQLSLELYSQTLTRVYSDGKSTIMLLIAYSARQTGFLQVHRPEFCYTAAGFALSAFDHHQIELSDGRAFAANTLTALRDGGGEKLLYWTRIGEHIPLSWAQQKLVFAEDNLRGLIPDAALVRISTPIGEGGVEMNELDHFVQDMVGETAPSMRRVLVA